MTEQAENQAEANTTAARDSLRILPLSLVPLETAHLRSACLIKNVYLESVVEFFRDEAAGSGQVPPDELSDYLGWPSDEIHPDLKKLLALARLNSFDVYSLRIELRRMGIPVNDYSQLCLSEKKSRELAGYMKSFTGPLIQQVFGAANPDIQDFDQLVGMFRSPNKEEALRNLKMLADKLQIDLVEVPLFLEDYGDTFLSLAYFKQCLDDVVPKVMEFLEAVPPLTKNHQLQNTHGFVQTCDRIDAGLNAIITSITGRFESFDQHSKDMWANISAESFRNVRRMITEHHSTVGGVLCGLSVKMDAWEERFGEMPADAAMVRKAEFVMGEMSRGLEKIERVEESAPGVAAAAIARLQKPKPEPGAESEDGEAEGTDGAEESTAAA